MIKEGGFYVKCLGLERTVIHIPIDHIYCKHESSYLSYRNNYRNQLKELLNKPDDLEYKRNEALVKVLKTQGWLHPIALLEYYAESPMGNYGFMCVDGHHRIKAYLTVGYDKIAGIIYKSGVEAGTAKDTIYVGDQHETSLEDFKESD